MIAYAQQGTTLIDPRSRTAGPGGDSRNDHLTGYGVVGDDNPAGS